MKTTAIIAEFNPFHNGHRYILDRAAKITSSDYIVVIMSGSFVQRGEPAFMHKYDRVKAALNCGADLVLELPVSYSTATAETFARGAISMADRIGVIDDLAFGAENDDIDRLMAIAETLTDPTPEMLAVIDEGLKKGLSYPAARSAALPDHEDILNKPNNILAIEYLKALISRNSSVTPVVIRRIGSSYNEKSILSGLPSACSIRNLFLSDDRANADPDNNLNRAADSTLSDHGPNNMISRGSWDTLRECLPDISFDLIADAYGKTAPITINDTAPILDHIMIGADVSDLSSYQDMNTDIANRMIRTYRDMLDISYRSNTPFTVEDLLRSMRTKELTYSRLSRALIHVILRLKDLTADPSGAALECPYARILGFRKNASELMRRLSDNSAIPLINKPADAGKLLDEHAYEAFDSTIRADRLYASLIKNKYGTILKDTCRTSPIII